MKLSKLEQESIILYTAEDSTASIYTHDPKLKRKLKRSDERRRAASERAKNAGYTPPARSIYSENE